MSGLFVLPGLLLAADISSKPWLHLAPIKTQDDVNKLKPDDTIAMVCSKCQSVRVLRVRDIDSKGRAKLLAPGTEHACPGCGGTITVRGDKQTEMVHVCSKCGEHSAFCCASKSSEKK